MDSAHLLRNFAIVPVVNIEDPKTAVPLAETLLEAGLGAVEITLRTPRAIEALELVATAFPDACIGAGSVRTAAHFSEVKEAGARFAVSPGFSELLLKAAKDTEMPFVPGATTASDIIRLQECGYSLVKFFPAELAGGVQMLKALGAPLPEARFFPTGGITPELAPDYLNLENVACIGGSWIAPGKLIAARDFKAIARLAKDAARLVR